jgi:hypothetical protein
MTVRNLIAPSGRWFAMMKDENDEGTVHPTAIAAFAIHSEGEHVVALIPDEESATLRPVTDDECVGIADEVGARDVNWQDVARMRVEAEKHEEMNRMARDHDLVASVAKRFADRMNKVVSTLTNIEASRDYFYEHKLLHELYEHDILETFDGGYRLTHFGRVVLVLLIESERRS